MTISRISFGTALLVIAVVLLTIPLPASADTYTIYKLGPANSTGLYGITSSGAVVTYNAECGEPGFSCYTTVVDGVVVGESTTAPVLSYDDGTKCSVSSGFASVGAASPVCNSGFIGFGSRYNPNGDPGGIYTGPTSDLSLIQTFGTTDQVDLNHLGDFAWTDGEDEYIYEAIDDTIAVSPEPSSVWLVGSGLLTVVGFSRRKMRKG